MLRVDKKFLGLQKYDDFKENEEMALGNDYAYNPIVTRNLDGSIEKFVEIIQESTKQDPEIVYAVPPHYTKDFTTRLWEFDAPNKFPDFSLPTGKVVALDIRNEVRNNDGMLSKGVTYAYGTSQSVGFVGDGFLIDLGCPPRGELIGNTGKTFDKWVDSVTQSQLNSAIDSALAPLSGKQLIMLNWECVHQAAGTKQQDPKLLDMITHAKSTYPSVQISAWNIGAASINRYNYERGYATNTTNTWLPTASVTDVGYCGGYITFLTNYSVIHHYLREYVASKILIPSKKTLATIWFDFEFLDDYHLGGRCSPKGRDVNEFGSGDGDYVWFNKPAVFNQVMYNWGVWTVAFGDGFHLWSDPDDWTDNVLHYPFGAQKFVAGTESSPVVQYLNKVNGKMYARNDMKNVDWLMRGVYGVSIHKTIINDNSGSWVINDIDDSLFNKKPLVAYKQTNSGTLILAYRWYALESSVEQVPVTIGGNTYFVETHGTWTGIRAI